MVEKTNKIISIICEYMGVDFNDVKSPSRLRKLSDTRKLISYFLSTEKMTRSEIGKILNRHHSTITTNHQAAINVLNREINDIEGLL